jgi:hypothetical protein
LKPYRVSWQRYYCAPWKNSKLGSKKVDETESKDNSDTDIKMQDAASNETPKTKIKMKIVNWEVINYVLVKNTQNHENFESETLEKLPSESNSSDVTSQIVFAIVEMQTIEGTKEFIQLFNGILF